MEAQSVLASNIVEAIEVANALRVAFGEELIPDLPPSQPADPYNCVLANAFNFDCKIDSPGGSGWGAIFEYGEDYLPQAKKLAELLHAEYEISYEANDSGNDYINEIFVPLPDSIAQIAIDFDANELPDRYYHGGK